MSVVAALMVVVVALVLPQESRGDFLNDYLNDKVFGENPGPCPTFAERCTLDYTEIPESIKDITICLLGDNSGCGRIGDLVKGGFFEIWELQCRYVSVTDILLERTTTSPSQLNSLLTLTNGRLACTFQLNVFDLVLELLGSFRVIATLTNTGVTFPVSGGTNTGRVDATVPLELSTTATFATDLPERVELPADECDISVDLNLDITLDSFDALTLCTFIPTNFFTLLLPKGWRCAQIVGQANSGLVSFLISFFNLDAIVSVVVRIIEAFIGGIVCQIIEEFAVLQDGSDGGVNQVLDEVNAQVDEWAASPSLDPAAADAAVVEPLALDFGASDTVQLVSTAINGWLGGSGLVVNELVDLLTDPDGEVALDVLATFPELQATVPIQVANITVGLNGFALGGLNTFSAFQVLDTESNRYTFRNAISMEQVSFDVAVRTRLAPGEWVTEGSAVSEFSFTFAMSLKELAFDAHTLVLFNFDEIADVRVGQPLASLEDFDILQALQCVSPALYALNFTNLEASLDEVLSVSMEGFSGGGLDALIEASVALGAEALRGAFKDKLPGVARGPLRQLINDVFAQEVLVADPTCAPYVAVEALLVVDYSSGLFTTVADAIDSSIGGDPIVDTNADINDLIEVVLVDFFGLPQGDPAVAGTYELLTEPQVFPSFDVPADSVELSALTVRNVDSIYKLRAFPTDDGAGGALNITFGVGAPAVEIEVPLKVQSIALGTDEDVTFTLAVSNVETGFAVSNLIFDEGFLRSLTFSELLSLPCLSNVLYDVTLSPNALSVGDVTLSVSSVPGSPASDLKDAIALVAAEAAAPTPRFDALLNSALFGGFGFVLDLLPLAKVDNCSSVELLPELPFNVSLEALSNASDFFVDVCIADIPPLPTVGESEATVVVPAGKSVFNLQESTLAIFLRDLLQEVLGGGGLEKGLLAIANTTGNAFGDALSLDVDGDVTLALPLSALGLRLEDDTFIPGLVLDAGTLRVGKVNKAVQTFNFLQLLGVYTTRYEVTFDTVAPLQMELEAVVEVASEAVGEDPALPSVREVVTIGFEVTDLDFAFELVSAIDGEALGVQTLGHFLAFNSTTQSVTLSDIFLDCFAAAFFPGGLFARELQIDIGTVQNVVFSSESNELLSEGFEALGAALTQVLVDFYKGAVDRIAQNCLRVFVNDIFLQLQEDGDCPAEAPLYESSGGPDEALLRFDESVDYLLLQRLWDDFAIQDDYVDFNAAIDGSVEVATFFPDASTIFFDKVPFAYYGDTFFSFDLGVSNIKVRDIDVTRLIPAAPVATFETLTQLASSSFSLELDVVLNLYDLFPDFAAMQNSFTLKLDLADFDFGFLVELKVNVTKALQLEFNTLADLNLLPCLVLPVEGFVPQELNLTVASFGLEVNCERCDLPFLKPTEALGFSTAGPDGEALAALFNELVAFASEYAAAVNAQALIDTYLASAEQTCDELLGLLLEFFSATSESQNVAAIMGVGILALSGVLGATYLVVYPVHKMRRKQALLENLSAAESDLAGLNGSSTSIELSRILTNTSLSMKALFQTSPAPANFLMPLMLNINLGLVVLAVAYTDILALVLKVTLLGAETEYLEIVPISMGSLINTIWSDLSVLVAGILALACVVSPVFENGLLLVIWFTPSSIYSKDLKRTSLHLLQLVAKTAFIILFAVATSVAFLFTQFDASDYAPLAALVAPEVGGVELNVRPKTGLLLLVFIAASTLVCALLMEYYNNQAANSHKKRTDELEGIKAAGRGPTRAFHARRALGDHRFQGVDSTGAARMVSPLYKRGTVALALLAMLLIFVGVLVPFVTVEINGLLGLLIAEISDGSPSIPADEPLHIRTFSLVEIGFGLWNSPRISGVDTLAVLFLQLFYFLFFIINPLMQLGVLVACLVVPLNLRNMRMLVYAQRFLAYWGGLELAVLTSVGIVVIVSPLVRIYVNFISGAVADDLCDSLEPLLLLVVPSAEDAYCMDTVGSFEPTAAIAFLGSAIQLAITIVFLFVSDAAINDRYCAAYWHIRSDARPQKWSRLARALLRRVTCVVPGTGNTPKEELSEEGNIFANPRPPAAGKPGKPNIFTMCCRYYAQRVLHHDEPSLDEQASRNLRDWQARFANAGHLATPNPQFQARVGPASPGDMDDDGSDFRLDSRDSPLSPKFNKNPRISGFDDIHV